MKHICLGVIVLAAIVAMERCAVVPADDFTQYVDPYIGTAHCRWFHFTPGAVPFGMAKPAPSTNGHLGNQGGWEATGYDYRDTSIEGFPCFHEFQVGGVVLMPTTGSLVTVPGAVNDSASGYRSGFDRSNETAQCGYYSVFLKKYGILAELTATSRVAFQRYTFPASTHSHILFDIGNRQGESGPVTDAAVTLTDRGLVEGFVETNPVYVNKYQYGASVKLFFSIQLDKQPAAWGTFVRDAVSEGSTESNGTGCGLYLTFVTEEQEKITAKVGMSYTSVENARLNRETEADRLTFDEAHRAAKQTWNDYLSRIAVESANRNNLVKFYTGLYHALLGRGLASDVNGAYPKHDGGVGQIPMKHNKPLFHHYNTDAVWGAFWNLTQVWALAYPEYYADFVNSQLLVYKDAGWLGDGIACSKYVSGVGTNFVGLVIAAAYNCGIRNFDIAAGFEAAVKNELQSEDRPFGAGKPDTGIFCELGYVDFSDSLRSLQQFAASHTLEYAFSAYAVAQMARQLGNNELYDRLMGLSKGWRQLYDSETGYMRPKDRNGRFLENFNPYQPWRGFQEGNAVQYTFYVPHDAEELVSLVGDERFVQRLDSIFTVARQFTFGGGTNIHAFSGLETVYNHGNQPCLHIPWLFNYTSRPSLSQKWVRTILDEFYGTEGIHGYGYGQDEDQGQLGAWFVISSLGLFDVKGLSAAEPSMGLGCPLFDRIVIRLNRDYYHGKQIEITTTGNAEKNCYAQAYTLNGKQYAKRFIPFAELVRGAKLEVKAGDQPVDVLSD
ncbi:MAG: GH92 family glycosyl hydrolase [Dysgonamonadaceae bacterium]|jgi:predicted alpha-1,2-mannosidase|nr:GH92 family glycosyl hydrolase [Dysgonamonadaceae bacterium]